MLNKFRFYFISNTDSLSIVLPIILRDGMGFTIAQAQCLVAPPYVAAAMVMFVQAYYGDKWHIRGPLIVGNAALGIIPSVLTFSQLFHC